MGLIIYKPAGQKTDSMRKVIVSALKTYTMATFGTIIVKQGVALVSEKGLVVKRQFNTKTNLWRAQDEDAMIVYFDHITSAEAETINERYPPFMLRQTAQKVILDYNNPDTFIVPSVYPFIMGHTGYHSGGFGKYVEEYFNPIHGRNLMQNGAFESLASLCPGISNLTAAIWGNKYRVYIQGINVFNSWKGIMINSDFVYSKICRDWGHPTKDDEIDDDVETNDELFEQLDAPVSRRKSVIESRYYYDKQQISMRYKHLYWHKKSDSLLPWAERQPWVILRRPNGVNPIQMISLWTMTEKSFLLYEMLYQFYAYPVKQLHNEKGE